MFNKITAKLRTLHPALTSREGAIDLASIMVGVIVIGVIAGTIAATVFAVIPWAQDRAAKSAFDAINTAQSAAFAQSADEGAGTYYASGEPELSAFLQNSDSVLITSHTGPEAKGGYIFDGQGFASYSLSQTGTVFFNTSDNPGTIADLGKINDPDSKAHAFVTNESGVLLEKLN